MAEKGAVPELVELLSSNDEELLTDLVNLASNLANQGMRLSSRSISSFCLLYLISLCNL
jgi:hypothetical protein